jgi:acetyl esterase/lipase
LLYLQGKTPRTVGYFQGSAVAFTQSSGQGVTLGQNRRAFATALSSVLSGVGLGSPEQKAQWVKEVSSENYSAFWMPFQDQTHKVTDGKVTSSKQEKVNIAKAKTELVSQSRVGEGCDLVVFYMHGGGFVQGDPLQSLDQFRNIMRKSHEDHGVKVSYFSVGYST